MELLRYGKIVKIHGLGGEVVIHPYSSNLDNFDVLTEIYLGDEGSTGLRKLSVEQKRIHNKRIIAKLSEVNTPEDAEKITGQEISVDKSRLSGTDEDEYYWYQLTGLKVITDRGEHIGIVKDLMDSAAHDILVVRNGEKEVLIPMIDKFVKVIDLENSLIIITPIEGMI